MRFAQRRAGDRALLSSGARDVDVDGGQPWMLTSVSDSRAYRSRRFATEITKRALITLPDFMSERLDVYFRAVIHAAPSEDSLGSQK
jgi:hypothetical protein